MKKVIAAACALLLAAAAPGVLAQTMSGPAADCAAIVTIFDTYAKAQNTDSLGMYLALWDEGAMQLRQDAPPIVGIKAIEQRVGARFGSTKFVTMIKTEEAVAAGDWGYARGIYTQTMTPKAGGASVYTEGKFLSTMRRQTDGTWRIYRDHSSSNAPVK